MHEIYAAGNGKARIEVVSHSTAQIESKREVLSLCIARPFGPLGVDVPETEAQVKEGYNSPVRSDKIAPNTHVIRPIPSFRSPRNRSEGPAEGHIPIATQNSRSSNVAHMPSQRSNVGFQRVLKPSHVKSTAREKVERPREIDGSPSVVQGEFESIFVINGSVAVRPLEFRGNLIRRPDR